MKKLEEIIAREKKFLIASGITLGTGALDSVSASYVISQEVREVYPVFHELTGALEARGIPTAELDQALNMYAATFEANLGARMFIEECGLNQGLFLHNLVVMVPVLAVAYFLNKINSRYESGNNVLYFLSGASAAMAVLNLYQ